MNQFLEFTIQRSRTILLTLVILMIAGMVAYHNMPKEAEPDVTIPIIYISMVHKGISPEDGERLLIRPMEKELRNIEGVKEMKATAVEGHASVVLEFEAGFNKEKALSDVREKVDIAKAELPIDAEEPTVNEVNFSQFPVLIVGLSGEIPERALLRLANQLKDSIETIPQVLEAEIAGDREDLLEILIEPRAFEVYNLSFLQVAELVKNNNQIVPAGTLEMEKGRFAVKVPGLYEVGEDLLNVPVKVEKDRVVRFKDIASIRNSFVDPKGFARIGNRTAVALEVKKRAGENMIATIEAVRAIVAREAESWPESLEISFFQDKSDKVKSMLNDLQNNLISAVALVMLVIIVAMGVRTAGLVGVAIPGSFLSGLFILHLMGLTINIVVLFSLILVVGMLVDGAIVVTEYADRKIMEGLSRAQAYVLASKRMALPIIASTATTLVAFMPLLFWPGVVGQFMKYLPITLICTLSASLVMALIFVPALGTLFGPLAPKQFKAQPLSYATMKTPDFLKLRGFTGMYLRILEKLLRSPFLIVFVSVFMLFAVYFLYGKWGKGVEFFPDVDPERITVKMRARGNLSISQYDTLLDQVEKKIMDMPEIETLYARSGVELEGEDITEDTHGIIFIEFVDWKKRRLGKAIIKDIEARLANIPGVIIEVAKERAGPPVGKPVKVELTSKFSQLLSPALKKIQAKMESMPALKDIDDSRSVPGIEWRIDVDRAQASRFGANIQYVGDMIQFVTTGLKIDGYRPEFADDEVDIRVRFPEDYRNLSQFSKIRVPTAYGLIPMSNFVTQIPSLKVGKIERVQAQRSLNVRADVKEGFLVDDQVKQLQEWIKKEADLDPRIKVEFKGEDEEQQKAQEFLSKAFLMALAAMAIILVTQFNSFYKAFLILTAVVFSTIGVFLGLLITKQPFGIVMNGIGVISLAGIVVNNNIVLIDTYVRLKASDPNRPALEIILRTCAQRLRPVMLTTITTILGLLPMVMKLNIDFVNREIDSGSPSTQWWAQLSTSVAFGLAFATLLTLILTPALLLLGNKFNRRFFAPKSSVS